MHQHTGITQPKLKVQHNLDQPKPAQPYLAKKGEKIKYKKGKWMVKLFNPINLFAQPLLEFFPNPNPNRWSIGKVCASIPYLILQSIDCCLLVD